MSGDRGRLVGLALVAAGVLAFVSSNPILRMLPSFAWLLVLMAVGAGVWTMSDKRMRFSQRIVLFAIVGIFAVITGGRMAGVAATGFIAMAFILSYLQDRKLWWALIPGGVMSGVTLIILLNQFFPRWDLGPLFLLLMAATFSVLYLLPKERGGQRWARYPAMVFIFITLISNDPSGRTPSWLIPALLIGSGMFVLYLIRKRPGSGD